MYKSWLQELCQPRRWAPPKYAHRRVGPNHAPLFGATVSVNGAEFRMPDDSARSAKEAHNIPAKAAFEHLSSLSAAGASPALWISSSSSNPNTHPLFRLDHGRAPVSSSSSLHFVP
ncbi:hypothetical protein E2562_031456 [Oryza meyeriana var. granulata]|uniref:DRBM domain-containing protein n=1 Tax=Oryza meyeriana var. granulata TaxID=110450 RepID=A0A6G1BPT4_9ORYZ|nr:hypothetical protein E2562_031456 [Oryza meyeriana var. granulata]